MSQEENNHECRIWIAESSIEGAGLGVYSGVAIKSGQIVGEPDIVIPLVDPDKRTWSPIHVSSLAYLYKQQLKGKDICLL